MRVSSSSSLTNAVTSGDESTVAALLANGADVNESTNGGQTALILAVVFGHTSLVRMLMNAGADPKLRDNLGLSAIEWAQRRGLNEAYAILTNSTESTTRPKRILIPVAALQESVAETPLIRRSDTVSDDEKSRRWLAGVKQRLDEQAMRRLNRNEPPLESRLVHTEPPPPPRVETGKETRVNGPWFWILLIITLTGSAVAGSLITSYLYKSNQAAPRIPAERQKIVQKGMPEVGTELAGKAVSLPEAECPVKGSEPVSGTVAVQIRIDKNGQVNWARGSGGDWLMRGCATEAAMKSTFDPEKLASREVEGTITYTFKP